MKTMKSAKSVLAVLAVCFTLAGTTSCKKADTDSIAPQQVIDTKLVGSWEKEEDRFNAVDNENKVEFTFNVDGTGTERRFILDRGFISNQRFNQFEWTVKSPGVIHMKKSSGEEADVTYRITGNAMNTVILGFRVPTDEKLHLTKIN